MQEQKQQAVENVRMVPAAIPRGGRVVVCEDNEEIVDNGARRKITFFHKEGKVERIKCLTHRKILDKDHKLTVIMTMPDGSSERRIIEDYRNVTFG